MPKLSPENLLAAAIDRLRSERATLVSRVSEIDASFGRLGIAVAVAVTVPVVDGKIGKLGKRRGRPPGSKSVPMVAKPIKPAIAEGKPATKNRKRGRFAVSGDQSILTFVQGAATPSTADVNAHWTKEGRGGKADKALSTLVKAGKLKRIVVEGERKSRYAIA